MEAIAALIPLIEILAFCLVGFVWLRGSSPPYSLAAALSLGIISGLGLLSLLLQVSFLLGHPALSLLLETLTLVGLVWWTRSRWGCLIELGQRCFEMWHRYPVSLSIFAVALGYLFVQAYLLPPSSWDALVYHLPRVLLWEQNQSLFLRDYSLPHQAVFPVGSDILFHLFLRFWLDYGLGIFSWLSYGVIACGTYAIARPRVSQAVALTTALVIACLPEIVYQSTATKNDIIVAAVAMACVVWADRWLRVPKIDALLGLALTLCFGVAVKTSFVLFAFFFLLLWLVLVIQQGLFFQLLQLPIRHWRAVVCCLLPGIVLSQIWLFWDNYQQYGEWLGPAELALKNQNNDGVWGAIANFTRYTFHSLHFLRPVEYAIQAISGQSVIAGLQGIYDQLFEPLFRDVGKAAFIEWQPFEVIWEAHEDISWFGPVSVFLVFPAVAWAMVKGRGLTRMMGLLAICLVGALSYKLGWSPWKTRFFTLAFGCTGLCVAMLLHDVQVRTGSIGTLILKGWRWVSLAILLYACLYNFTKPMIPSDYYIGRHPIWFSSNWTRDRTIYSKLYDGLQLEQMSEALASAQKIGIAGYGHYFSLMFHNPSLEFLFLFIDQPTAEAEALAMVEERLGEIDHLVCFNEKCATAASTSGMKLLWQNDSEAQLPAVYQNPFL
ncbi:MAG: hypothetical protein F6K00_14550 [Leptolyngbya sp. SIOISBB]|nr:hypothetical protein [Leptolyngbya sp. SIOISBB]